MIDTLRLSEKVRSGRVSIQAWPTSPPTPTMNDIGLWAADTLQPQPPMTGIFRCSRKPLMAWAVPGPRSSKKAWTPCCSTIPRARDRARPGSPPSSAKITLTGCPLTPPRAFTSPSHALSPIITAARIWPSTPLSLPIDPRMIGALAPAGARAGDPPGTPGVGAGEAPGVFEPVPVPDEPPDGWLDAACLGVGAAVAAPAPGAADDFSD